MIQLIHLRRSGHSLGVSQHLSGTSEEQEEVHEVHCSVYSRYIHAWQLLAAHGVLCHRCVKFCVNTWVRDCIKSNDATIGAPGLTTSKDAEVFPVLSLRESGPQGQDFTQGVDGTSVAVRAFSCAFAADGSLTPGGLSAAGRLHHQLATLAMKTRRSGQDVVFEDIRRGF